jgi:hypothetical protein
MATAAAAAAAAVVEQPAEPRELLRIAAGERDQARAALARAEDDLARAGQQLDSLRTEITRAGDPEQRIAQFIADEIAAGRDGDALPANLIAERVRRDQMRSRLGATEAAAQRLAQSAENAKAALREREASVGQAAEAVLAVEVAALVDQAHDAMARLQGLVRELAGAAALWVAIPGAGVPPRPFKGITPDVVMILRKVAQMAGPDQPPPGVASEAAVRWQAKLAALLR